MLLNRIRVTGRSIAGFCFLFLFTLKGWTQNQNIVKPFTPNAATFDKFSSVPVDLFTGTPNISVPLHTVTYGTINVPIALRYHPSSVKAGSHPSWVGTGWDLEAGGSIRRTVHKSADEYYTTNDPNGMGNFEPYYPWPGEPTNGTGSGSELVSASDWSSANALKQDFSILGLGGPGVDVEADEFSFSFLGHGGTFYYQDGQWQVISDENIKVQLNAAPDDFLSAADVDNIIHSYHGISGALFNNTSVQGRAFKSFTLTTADGTKYTFGGTNAVEFTCSYTANTPGPIFTASSWMLTKIVDPYNNEVDFTYTRSYAQAELFIARQAFDYNCATSSGGFGPSGSALAAETGIVDPSPFSGIFQWPVYLQSINTPNETALFTSTVATCLRHSDAALRDLIGNPASGQYVNVILNSDLTNLQWLKLDNINIFNVRGRGLKQYQFGYNNVSTQRLALQSLTEEDALMKTVAAYQFAYNNIAGLPLYDGNNMDHWGFFNNKLISHVDIHSIYPYRVTDPNYVTTGLLTKITYPTGGYTLLNWEAHKYSQYVSTDRTQLLPQSSNSQGDVYAGGSRIASVISYTPDGTLADQKHYYYVRGYHTTANLSTLTSSGVLNGLPQYVFDISSRSGILQSATFATHLEFLNPFGSYSYNGSDSYIGYDEVAEVEADLGYTIHQFTTYGTDINHVSHFDQAPISTLGWNTATDIYVPHTNLDRERGKPIAINEYTASDVLQKSTVNTYRSDPARFNSFLKLIENNQAGSTYNTACASDGLILATANKLYSYMYYPVTQTVTNFDQYGQNPVTEVTNFTYNLNNLVATRSIINSKNETVTHAYKYTTEGTDAASLQMAGNTVHMLNYMIEDRATKTPPGSSTALLQKVKGTVYNSFNGLFLPQFNQEQNGSNALENRQQYYQYDGHGNILEASKVTDMHTVYLWSYNSQYPVAKIDNSTYSAVSALITQAQIDAATPNDATMRSLFQTLRGQMPGTMITSYTYSPVYGMTSQTDAQGRNTYYDYDNFGRLVAIRDQDANIVKRYCYNYAGQPENCPLVYSADKNNSFTPACPAGFAGAPVYYDVPEGTYTGSSQQDADQMATIDLVYNGQALANATSPCKQIVCNDEQDGTFTKPSSLCGLNQHGETKTYVVPAGTYCTIDGKDAANQLARNDVAANGQNWVNQNGQCFCDYGTIVLSVASGVNANGYRAVFTDANGVDHSFNFPASGATTTVTTTFPIGTYKIGFAPTGGPGSNHSYKWQEGPDSGSASGQTSALFPGVFVQCTITLTIF